MRFSVLSVLLGCFLLCGCGPTTVNSLVKEGATQLPAREELELVKGNTLALHGYSRDAPL